MTEPVTGDVVRHSTTAPSTYAAAGVDVEAGEHAVALMKASIARAQRPEVVGDVGGFAGMFDISLEQLVAATTVPRERLCAACFDGHYPVALPEPELLGKHLLEGFERSAGTDADGLCTLIVGGGAQDALSRP